jgi:hypothetical protein
LVGRDIYQGSTRQDEHYLASVMMTYKVTREFAFKGEWRREWRSSNTVGNGYVADVMLLGVRLQR